MREAAEILTGAPLLEVRLERGIFSTERFGGRLRNTAHRMQRFAVVKRHQDLLIRHHCPHSTRRSTRSVPSGASAASSTSATSREASTRSTIGSRPSRRARSRLIAAVDTP
jgi:hypothetical protein